MILSLLHVNNFSQESSEISFYQLTCETCTGLTRKKLPCVRRFVRVNLSPVQSISKVFITVLTNDSFWYLLKTSVNTLILMWFLKIFCFLIISRVINNISRKLVDDCTELIIIDTPTVYSNTPSPSVYCQRWSDWRGYLDLYRS